MKMGMFLFGLVILELVGTKFAYSEKLYQPPECADTQGKRTLAVDITNDLSYMATPAPKTYKNTVNEKFRKVTASKIKKEEMLCLVETECPKTEKSEDKCYLLKGHKTSKSDVANIFQLKPKKEKSSSRTLERVKKASKCKDVVLCGIETIAMPLGRKARSAIITHESFQGTTSFSVGASWSDEGDDYPPNTGSAEAVLDAGESRPLD